MDLPSSETMLITPRYGDALAWADALHRDQRRKGLVWEEGGTEDQAIAGLLHDAIEDAGQSHGVATASRGVGCAGQPLIS